MKVYVTTKARPFQYEQFIGVFSTKKKAESSLRKEFPHMRKSFPTTPNAPERECLISDAYGTFILFIREKEVDE